MTFDELLQGKWYYEIQEGTHSIVVMDRRPNGKESLVMICEIYYDKYGEMTQQKAIKMAKLICSLPLLVSEDANF